MGPRPSEPWLERQRPHLLHLKGGLGRLPSELLKARFALTQLLVQLGRQVLVVAQQPPEPHLIEPCLARQKVAVEAGGPLAFAPLLPTPGPRHQGLQVIGNQSALGQPALHCGLGTETLRLGPLAQQHPNHRRGW